MVSCPGIPSGNLICLSISLCIFNYARESINSFLDKNSVSPPCRLWHSRPQTPRRDLVLLPGASTRVPEQFPDLLVETLGKINMTF